MQPGNWTETEVKQFLRENSFSYQRIELPYGLSTPGTDRSSTAKIIFPSDMTGKSVLDLGMKYGYFSFEALKRGASRVVGVDIEPDCVTKARKLADCLGVQARFEILDIEKDLSFFCDEQNKFDYVLCLNLLHHLKNPLGLLERLTLLTKDRLILEVATLGRYDGKKLGISWNQMYWLNRAPIIYATPSGAPDTPQTQKFFFTKQAIENILVYQGNKFGRIETYPSDHNDRYISIVHKRKISTLIGVMGPTASGKTTLIQKILNDPKLELWEKIGLTNQSELRQMSPNQIPEPNDSSRNNLIFEYDFLRPFKKVITISTKDQVLELLDIADRAITFTIWAPPNIINARWQQIQNAKAKKTYWLKKPKGNKKIREEYFHPFQQKELFQHWFSFLHTKPGNHFVVTTEPALNCYSLKEWENGSWDLHNSLQ